MMAALYALAWLAVVCIPAGIAYAWLARLPKSREAREAARRSAQRELDLKSRREADRQFYARLTRSARVPRNHEATP